MFLPGVFSLPSKKTTVSGSWISICRLNSFSLPAGIIFIPFFFSFFLISLTPINTYAGEEPFSILLKGTVTGDVEVPVAVIEDTYTGKQKAYRQHEIVKGFEIVEINGEEIVLRKMADGARFILKMGRYLSQEPEQPPELNEFFTFQRDEVDLVQLSDQIFGEARQKKASTKMEDGPTGMEITGITVTYVEGGSLFEKMDLKSGDVLLEFRGERSAPVNQ